MVVPAAPFSLEVLAYKFIRAPVRQSSAGSTEPPASGSGLPVGTSAIPFLAFRVLPPPVLHSPRSGRAQAERGRLQLCRHSS